MKIADLNYGDYLICPDSSIKDSVAFEYIHCWLDASNCRVVDCQVCGGEHYIGDMEKDELI